MNETTVFLKKLGLMLMSMIILLGGAALGHAQMSVGATPLKTVLEIDPGATQTFEIKAINRNSDPMNYKVEIQTAEADGEFGNASFRPAEPGEKLAVPNWITIENPTLTVPANEMSPVKFSITVPKDTPPGGYYGMVLFAPADIDTGEGNVAIVGQIGTPLLVKVTGDIIEDAYIDSLELNEASLMDGEAIEFALRFVNKGNVHILPHGKLFLYQNDELLREVASIKKEDGTTEIVDYVPLNASRGYTLPGQPRMYFPTWEFNHVYGDITAKYSLEYGKENPQTIEGELEVSIAKDIEVADFSYDSGAEEFVVSMKNNGNVQMPLRGQINVYANAGGDPRVTISFPRDENPVFIAKGETKEIRIPWNGLSVLQPSKSNQFHAMLTYVVDKDSNQILNAKAELPYGSLYGAAFDVESLAPYIIISLLLIVIGVLLIARKKPHHPQNNF